MKLLSFGEIIWDIFPSAACIGGAPLNFAAHAAMQGADTYMLSAVGDDELGKRALDELTALGVATEHVSVSAKPTGSCVVTLDQAGVPSYDLKGDTAYDDVACPTLGDGHGFDVISFGTLALRGTHNRELLARVLSENRFPTVFSDLNIRAPFYSDESIAFCMEHATIVKISDEELDTVTASCLGYTLSVEDAARALAKKYAQLTLVIITKGADGAYAYDTASGVGYSCPAFPAEAVSTVGAGDSFGATFLTQYFSGKSIPECLDAASRVSGFVVSCTGAVPKYDLCELLAK